MSTVAPLEPLAVQPDALTLDAFYERVRDNNPFAVNIVPASLRIEDAKNVHQTAYHRLLELANEAGRQHTGLGVMLWGEAGIGKSHLLARLAAWADPDHKQGIFVYLANLKAGPEQLPRSLLRCVMSILTHGRTSRLHDTQLFRVVNAAIRHALQDDDSRTHSWNEAEAAYDRLVDELCGQGPGQAAAMNRQVFAVLLRFYRSAYFSHVNGDDEQTAARAVRWLSGDYLDVEEAKELGLPPGPRREEGVALADDLQIQNVLAALARLASYRQQPLIMCFDQVEALEPEQFSALARFLHTLIDAANNLLVITSGVREELTRWEADGVIPRSTWDRLALHQIELQRVSVPEARQIVQARLQPFQEPFLCLEAVKERIGKDYLFPLGERWAAEFLAGKIEVRPRDVINWAREGWRRQQEALRQKGGQLWLESWEAQNPPPPPPTLSEEEIQALIDEKVALKLQEHKRQRQLEPQTLPPDGDNLAGLLHSLLQRCLGTTPFPSLLGIQSLVKPRYGQRPPYDLVLRQRNGLDDKETRSGLLCLVVSNRTSMAAFLRRLALDTQPPGRLFLITDERRPLTPATAGREHLDKLQQRHGDRFVRVSLTFDQYAELDALQATVGLAKSGDLEIELPGGLSRRVSETEVVASHLRQQRYTAHPLLKLLLDCEQVTTTNSLFHQPGAPATGSDPSLALRAGGTDSKPEVNEDGSPFDIEDLRQFIMARLAITMGASSNELAAQYQDYSAHKGVQLEVEVCKVRLEEAARSLHLEGRLNATAHDDYLYLWREGDALWLGQDVENGRPVTLPRAALPTHVAVVGAAGSGKTWLAKVLAEEAVALGVPLLAIDPQGDLVQLIKHRDSAAFPQDQLPRYEKFWQLAEPRIFTPGSSHGTRICLSPIRLPRPEELSSLPEPRRREELDGLLSAVAGNLVNAARAGGDADCQRTFVFQLLRHLTDAGTDPAVGLADVAGAVSQPETVGMDDADRFIKKSERENLARKLHALLLGPASGLFTGGQPLDVGHLLRPSEAGKVPLNVFYLNALPDDEQKQIFVATLAAEVYRWMVTEGSGEAKPQALVYLDEARDFIPAGARKPPAKEPLVRLFTQGRKYGVACLICTQSPRSVDYNVFGNCSTKIIGRLESSQDVDRVAEWFGKDGPAPPWLQGRKGADPGTFVGRWPGQSAEGEGRAWKSRCLFSWHEGAWSPEQLEREIRACLSKEPPSRARSAAK